MANETYARMTIAHSNKVNPTDVTAIVTSGLTTQTGFPASNLEFEDPWTIMKTATITPGPSVPIIEHQFAASQSFRIAGVINHNLRTAGYISVDFEYWTGSAWSLLGFTNVRPDDGDLLAGWTNVVSSTRWRIKLPTAASNFFIGSIFWGARTVLEQNPTAAGVIQTREAPFLVEQSAGGAKHVTSGANKRSGILEATWSRGMPDDVKFFAELGKYELLGVLSPEYADFGSSGSFGHEIFWGYVVNRVMSPRGPGNSTDLNYKYDMTLSMEGAV